MQHLCYGTDPRHHGNILVTRRDCADRASVRCADGSGRCDLVAGSGRRPEKSHFARALIQSRLAAIGRFEDVPSPTFTLVQCYDLGSVDLWHADLYRLTSPSECDELGLVDAFESAICLVEWPDRLAS